MGVQEAAESLMKMEPEPVTFFSDSQAALISLASMKIKDRVVAKCSETLNLLGRSREVTLKWVKAYL